MERFLFSLYESARGLGSFGLYIIYNEAGAHNTNAGMLAAIADLNKDKYLFNIMCKYF